MKRVLYVSKNGNFEGSRIRKILGLIWLLFVQLQIAYVLAYQGGKHK